MYQTFIQEALDNVKEGKYRNNEEAMLMYRYYINTLHDMAKQAYYLFREKEMGYTDKISHGIVPDSRIREFIQKHYELSDKAIDRIMFVMLHPEPGREKERYITERQGGGIVV